MKANDWVGSRTSKLILIPYPIISQNIACMNTTTGFSWSFTQIEKLPSGLTVTWSRIRVSQHTRLSAALPPSLPTHAFQCCYMMRATWKCLRRTGPHGLFVSSNQACAYDNRILTQTFPLLFIIIKKKRVWLEENMGEKSPSGD